VRPGGCGSDPRTELTEQDRVVVAEFMAWLRATAHQRDTPAGRTPYEQWRATRGSTPER
jgi:hypothetical protein